MTRLSQKLVIGGVTAAILLSGIAFGGCGDNSSADIKVKLGNTTDKDAVVRALEGTGYKVTYRRIARAQGFDQLAGEARSKNGGRVESSVVVRRQGPYEGRSRRKEESPQPPILRYAEARPTTVGNAAYGIAPQSPYVLEQVETLGQIWVPDPEEARMSIRLGVALKRLFAPQVRGQG